MNAMSLYAIVLAAGSGRRFGETKQLAQFAGQSLVERAVRLAESLCASKNVLIVGQDAARVAQACSPLQGFLIYNDGHKNGIGESIAVGVRGLGSAADGVLIMLADQPLICAEDLERLATAWRSQPNNIVASAYAGTWGPPVIFPRADFETLKTLSGDRGARAILEANKNRVTTIACAAAACDIDNPLDLQNIQDAETPGC